MLVQWVHHVTERAVNSVGKQNQRLSCMSMSKWTYFVLVYSSTIERNNGAGRVAYVEERLPSTCEAWSSNPSTAKKEKNNNKGIMIWSFLTLKFKWNMIGETWENKWKFKCRWRGILLNVLLQMRKQCGEMESLHTSGQTGTKYTAFFLLSLLHRSVCCQTVSDWYVVGLI
jgi:hypothetical protein